MRIDIVDIGDIGYRYRIVSYRIDLIDNHPGDNRLRCQFKSDNIIIFVFFVFILGYFGLCGVG